MVPWSPPASTNNNNNNNGPNSNKKALTRKMLTPQPIATSSSMCLNGPESAPVLFNPCADSLYKRGCTHSSIDEDDEERCLSCHSTALVTDWKQGDRVCTNCGVVAEARLMDDRPEWKDFNEAEDIIKGLPSKSRSGMVAVDETKYIGGLQPTILSKDAFGGDSGGFKMTKIRRQLKATNKRLDHIMEKVHKRALKDAKLERRVRLKRESENNKAGGISSSTSMRRTTTRDCDGHPEIRPEFDMIVLQEEENANQMHAAIYADKWSLDRAIFLYGTSEDSTRSLNQMNGESREELLSHMDKSLLGTSQDLYTAYAMITQAMKKLRLPNRVVDEVIHRFVRYTTRRDGFTVKGVSSRLPNRKGKETKEERKIAAARLREYNKMKQISSLGAAVVFLTARTLGWARTVVEVCDCFQPSLEHSNEPIRIKPKHVSCAMNEIKSYFPEYTRKPIGGKDSRSSLLSNSNSTSNFADHFIRNLQLPPVAEACIRALLVHCKHEQEELGVNSGIKMSTLCAAITYFVCTAGAAMQKVAHQVHSEKDNASKTKQSSSKLDSLQMQSSVKERNASSTDTKSKEKVEKSQNSINKDAEDDTDEDSNYDDAGDSDPFDVFSHAPVIEDQPEKLEYDMRRMWDAWAEQMAWSRSLLEIEQSCSISSNIILNLYKSDMYPRRESLLNALKAAVTTEQVSKSECTNVSHSLLKQTPLASILLPHIPTAGALMSSK